jgi:uncharacterized protein involved in response to NO
MWTRRVRHVHSDGLPSEWLAAYERNRQGFLLGNDPGPERRAGRVLGAFVATGLLFVALPGTLLGVINLLNISGHEQSTAASTAWIQSHGQAQLFGWVGSFIIGISLYVLPKFLGRRPDRFAAMWGVWALWTAGAAWRWWAGVSGFDWKIGLPAAAVLELAAFCWAQYLLWFDRHRRHGAPSRKTFPGDLASWLGLVGFGVFGLALLVNLGLSIYVVRTASAPIYPAVANRIFLILFLWGFVIPVAWGYSTRFVTVFAGLERPSQSAARWLAVGVVALAISALLRWFLVVDLLALSITLGATWALHVFSSAEREPKRAGVYARFPVFTRVAYGWLVVGVLLGLASDLAPQFAGLGGASRHAITVGFVATLILCVGPLILPSFQNGRQLFSARLMAASLWFISFGCLLRVSSESIAYSQGGVAWKILPISATLELTAILLFVVNLGMTMIQRKPAWFNASGVSPEMPVYFCVTSFPKTRKLLTKAGLNTLGRVKEIPPTLTLAEAALADQADLAHLLAALRRFFADRQPRRTSEHFS